MTTLEKWSRFGDLLLHVPSLGISVDVSRMGFDPSLFEAHHEALQRAFDSMEALENGALANPDEGRMVGHYWLRAPERAPDSEITRDIEQTLESVRKFAAAVSSGRLIPERGGRFESLLVIGIGGSALGPQFVSDALGQLDDTLAVHFFDNTDPDGMARVLDRIGDRLAKNLTLIVSKSGGTAETRNGMLVATDRYRRSGLDFARHAVAITQVESALDRVARSDGWLARFPMWDWVGGRTSELSAVGLLPAALQGVDIDAMLAGAAAMDDATRSRDALANPAALMALMWYHAGGGRGTKDMVVLPYRDRLLLFSRYLQQLVMESLGKKLDLEGRPVHQGLSVYGNKGSTDQHAYVQQLRDGINNVFVTFIHVLQDGGVAGFEVEPGITPGDYLLGFLLGTREALHESGRESITIMVPDASARTIGALIALYERTVGLYASLVNVNAYHQPGVEAGKKVAAAALALQARLVQNLSTGPNARTAHEIARDVGAEDHAESAWIILEHLAANGRAMRFAGKRPTEARYGPVEPDVTA